MDLDYNLAAAVSPGSISTFIWGAVLTRYLTTARFGGHRHASAGRVPDSYAGTVVERERERWHLSQKIVGYSGVVAPEDGADAAFKMVHQTARMGSS